MPNKKIDVFLSSDQKEFEIERNRLSKIICEIPFCSCTPLEKRGADTVNVVEVSLKAVRKCDVYIGIFGSQYSETANKEYKEAVKGHKSCLCYVKKTRNRNAKLERFINDELRNRFKYHEFKGKAELYKQIKSDLEKLIFETLIDGLEFRKKEQEKAIRIIETERKTQYVVDKKEDPLSEAQIAYEKGMYLECLLITTIVLEKELTQKLRSKTKVKRLTLGQLLRLATKYELIDKNQIGSLVEMAYMRNAFVHGMQTPRKEDILWVLNTTRRVLQHLKGREKAYSIKEIRKTYPRAYKKWTEREDEQLRSEYEDGLPIPEIAKIHQRKVGAIESRLRKLGIVY